MSNVENISYSDVIKGQHRNNPENTVLIQIVDVGMDFPIPKYQFKEVYQFNFMDLTEATEANSLVMINEEQAKYITEILVYAKALDYDISVHCVAGLCRSGAVAEVAEIMGFNYIGKGKQPNSYVKRILLEQIGYYDGLLQSVERRMI